MRTLHALAFLLAFTLDVRVRAAEVAALPNSPEVLQEPAGCVLRSSVCAVKTRHGEKFKFSIGPAIVVLDASTSVIRLSENAVTLLSGTIWVQGGGALAVRSEFGAVRGEVGEFWVSRTADRMTVSATDGPVVLEPRGSKVALRLDVGEENWIGRVGGDGVATTGVPQAITFAEHLRRWARLFPGTKRELEKAAGQFHRSWARGLASVADYHASLAERRRRALRDEENRRAEIKAQEGKRSAELRALYRRKVLFD